MRKGVGFVFIFGIMLFSSFVFAGFFDFLTPNGDALWNVNYCSESNLCDEGQGDCDNDGECKPGLVCINNIGGDYGQREDLDICEKPGLGSSDYCVGKLCDEGQGDCDNDGECKPGLVCINNVGANYGFRSDIDVCEKPGLGSSDYCVGKLCEAGQGDCDNNGECKSGLVCVNNVGANYGFRSDIDVCEVSKFGGNDYCVGRFCEVGQGDCDNNGECKSGLVCVDDVGEKYGFRSIVDVCECPSGTSWDGMNCDSGSESDAFAGVNENLSLLSCNNFVTTESTISYDYGVASFDVSANSAVAWTHAGKEVSLQLRWGVNPDNLDRCLVVETTENKGYIAAYKLIGLSPATQYYYRFDHGDSIKSPLGQFRTAKNPGTAFKFIFSGDVHQSYPNRWDLFEKMQNEEADFYLSLGDWPYADNAFSREEYREIHKKGRGDVRITNFFKSLGVWVVFDDHEVKNDWDGKTKEDNLAMVEAGLDVWAEWFGIVDTSSKVYYRQFTWSDLDFFLLDTRSYRDRNSASDELDLNGLPIKSMLGVQQREWLLDGLRKSTSPYKLIITSVPLDFGSTGKDHWPGFARERDLITQTIVDEKIDGVVFLTADQHWFSANHHNTGLKEFQVGPISAPIRSPTYDRNTRAVSKVYNYGVMKYNPVKKSLIFEAWEYGPNPNPIYTEEINLGRGTIRVETNIPAPFILCPNDDYEDCVHTFTGTGTQTFDFAPVGNYKIRWREVPGFSSPTNLDISKLRLEEGREIKFVGTYTPLSPVLLPFRDIFDTDKEWFILDEGENSKPSDWKVVDGVFQQNSNIYGGSVEDESVDKVGTMALHGSVSWKDYLFSTNFLTSDDDSLGLVARYQGENNYYRCSMDLERQYIRLVSNINGKFTILDSQNNIDPYVKDVWTNISMEVNGDKISCMVDGVEVVSAVDNSLKMGMIGLYSWGSNSLRFDNVLVESISSSPSSCNDSDGGRDIYKRGTTIGPEWANIGNVITRTDSCSTKLVRGITEYYCKESQGMNYTVSESIDCPNGCFDGACAYDGGEKITLIKKDATNPKATVNIDGKYYIIKLINGDETNVIVSVNDGRSKKINEGSSKTVERIKISVKSIASLDGGGVTAVITADKKASARQRFFDWFRERFNRPDQSRIVIP